MAYTPEYTSTDLTAAIIDFIGTAGVALIGFAALVGLVLVYKWFTGRKRVKV